MKRRVSEGPMGGRGGRAVGAVHGAPMADG